MIKTEKYRLNKFEGYTLEDCDCSLCLHYAGKGKPCPLDTCCCEDEKREAIAQTSSRAKPELPPLRHRIDPFQPERPISTSKPECAGCAYPGHGFICGGSSGDCLKTIIARRGRLSPCLG